MSEVESQDKALGQATQKFAASDCRARQSHALIAFKKVASLPINSI